MEVKRLGYIEAKFPSKVSLDDVESINVPKEKLEEVLSWPEANKWKDKIKPY